MKYGQQNCTSVVIDMRWTLETNKLVLFYHFRDTIEIAGSLIYGSYFVIKSISLHF